jgi:hypothetical protein
MASVIETERLTLRIRDERDAEWYRELVGERGEDAPSLRVLEKVGFRRHHSAVIEDRGDVVYLVRDL